MVDKLPIMPVINGARYKLQPVHYVDLADAYFRVLISESKTTNKDFVLSGGNEIELREMLRTMGNCLVKKVHFVNCPFGIAYIAACCLCGISFKKVDYREKVQRLYEPRIYSHEAARKDFRYNPRTFQEGIIIEVMEYQKGKG